jgi:hypothetical protein
VRKLRVVQRILYRKIAELMKESTPNVMWTEATKTLSVVAPDMHETDSSARPFRTGISEVNMTDVLQGVQKDWRELCVAVQNESDSMKLSSLLQELIDALDRGERSGCHAVRPADAIETNRDTA